MKEINKTFLDIRVSTLLKIAIFVGVLYLVSQIFQFLIILLTALVIATFADPFHEFVVARFSWIPRAVNVLVFFITALLIFGGVIAYLVPIIIGDAITFLEGAKIDIISREDLASLSTALQGSDKIQDIVSAIVNTEGVKNVLSPLGALFGGVVNTLILVILTLYVALQERGLERFLRVILPKEDEDYIVSVWTRTQKKIAKWFQYQLLIAVLVAMLTSILLWSLGVQHAILIGILAGVFGLAPYGIVVAFIPSAILGFLAGGLHAVLLILVSFVVVQLVLDYLVQPIFMHSATGIPSLFIIIAMIIGAQTVGIWGVILAIPVATLLVELINDFEQRKRIVREDEKRSL